MAKRLRVILLVLSLVLTACTAPPGGTTPPAAVIEPGRPPSGAEAAMLPPGGAPAPDPATDSASALSLAPEKVLNWAPYEGGQVGETQFRAGRVLLWAPEPGQLSASAVVAQADGTWQGGGNSTTTVLSKDPRFAPSVAIVNPVGSADRKVPLNAIFGLVHDPATSRVQIRLPGDGWYDARLSNGTYLFVWQGVIFGAEFEVVALDGGGQELEKVRVRTPL